MTISRLTVDKLGVKLYDRVSAVIAEVVANSYDADAKVVSIAAPMGQLLATKTKGKVEDSNYWIEVTDNGVGMTAEEVNSFYLKVGGERRNDPRRGNLSKIFKRRVMGRKGVGKLAPFGVCQRIEVITAGGKKITGKDEKGKTIKGYAISHLYLDRSGILEDKDTAYYPQPGFLDGLVRPQTGTSVRLTIFDHRWVPELVDFERQMAQRFGLSSPNWKIILRDSLKSPNAKDAQCEVGQFELKLKPNTRVNFKLLPGSKSDSRDAKDFTVEPPSTVKDWPLLPGFEYDGSFYPVTGWVGYAEKPYKDDLMAGIRIYCRGKIAAQTAVFNIKAGFTGEHDVRSYLIGELHTDWLDESEDLIRTDRQDILWSQELGQAFQTWGQSLVKAVGRITREPMRQDAWEQFLNVSKLDSRIQKAFPGKEHQEIRDKTRAIAKTISKSARLEELEDPEYVESIVQLSLLLGPHITLDEKLREAAETKDQPLAVVSEVLKTARIAELSSFGRIADDRVRVIETLEQLKDAPGTLESAFQKLLTEAPWLINPTWSPIAANQTFETLKTEFAKYYKKETGEELRLDDFSDPKKRADFVLSNQDEELHLVEIKRPDHALKNDEMDRIDKYYQLMGEFLHAKGNELFAKKFPKYQIMLVCDKLALTGVRKTAFERLQKDGTLNHMSWRVFLARTRQMHQAFLNEAQRQRKMASS